MQASGQPEPTLTILDGNVNAMTNSTLRAQKTLQELLEGNARFQQVSYAGLPLEGSLQSWAGKLDDQRVAAG